MKEVLEEDERAADPPLAGHAGAKEGEQPLHERGGRLGENPSVMKCGGFAASAKRMSSVRSMSKRNHFRPLSHKTMW